ncbi:hypothetical protein GCM10022247_12570 [Allokutzneria multivorans]|uniref:Intracellular proteinase inhibitor BsuPI domain-containing protein n=2 Tax=Allokutzneria multivorans TaxID=1142134 RepID=A0ABP7R958_9PSEU
MKLTTEVGQPEYRVGQRPELRLVIANSGPVACYRDLDAGLREIVVTSVDGGTRLWSSNDCYASNSPNSRLLQPGEGQMFKVAWAGRTSAPGCAGKRTSVPAGDYLVVPKLGALQGQPTPLRLN